MSNSVTVDQERTFLKLEVGSAISAWATIELILFEIFNKCFSKNDRAVLYTAYVAVDNFRSKLQIVDLCFKERFSESKPAVYERWTEIHSLLIKNSKARNQLVHRLTQTYEEAKAGRRAGLVVPLDVIRPIYRDPEPKIGPAPAGTLFIRDVVQIELRFGALLNDLWGLLFALQKDPAPLPISLSQPESPPNFQQITSRIRADLKPQP